MEPHDPKSERWWRESETRILEMVACGATLQAVLDETTNHIDTVFPDTVSSILLLDPDGLRLHHAAAPHLPEAFCRAMDGMPVGPNAGCCGAAAYRRKPVITSDIETHPLWNEYRDLALHYGLRACWSTPVTDTRGNVLAIFALYHREPKVPAKSDRQLITRAARLIGMAIERSRNEETVRQQQWLLRVAGEVAEIGGWVMNRTDHRVCVSDVVYDILELPRGEPVSLEETLACFAPECRRRLKQAIDACLDEGTPFDLELAAITTTGRRLWLRSRGDAERDTDGTVKGVRGTFQNVTDHKLADEARQESERRLSTLLGNLPGMAYRCRNDAAWTVEYVSEGSRELTGYAPDELIDSKAISYADLIHPDDRNAVFEQVQTDLARGGSFCLAYRIRTRHGEERWVWEQGCRVYGERPDDEMLEGFITDITQRKRQELQVERSNRALRILSQCNAALIHAQAEPHLLETICRIAVDTGGYRTAWAGYAHPDGTITPVASAGDGTGISRESGEPDDQGALEGHCPAAHAVRTGNAVFVDDLANDPEFAAPWPGCGTAGHGGCLCLPLTDNQGTFGVLVLFKADTRPVPPDEQTLLQDLADDIAYGVAMRRVQGREARLKNAVLGIASAVSAHSGEDFFEQLVRNMTATLEADAGYVVRLTPGQDEPARTIMALVDGEISGTATYRLMGSPFEAHPSEPCCVVQDGVTDRYPDDRVLAACGARGCVGQRLDTSAGEPLGLLFVLYREPIADPDFVVSTLQIFASRAAAELERLEAETRIREQAALLEQTRDTILLTDWDGRILVWNKGAEHTFGWPAEEALGASCLDLLRIDPGQFEQARDELQRNGYWGGELTQTTRSGDRLIIESHWTLSSSAGDQAPRILQVGSDVTRRKQDETRIHRLAFYDTATGLPNRTLGIDRLARILAEADRQTERAVVLLINLNRFKEINETFSHDVGDQVLLETARRFESVLGEGMTLARVGGDEFLVIAPRSRHDAAIGLAGHLQAALREPLAVFDDRIAVNARIGIAMFPHDGVSADDLIKHADLAMRHAKRTGQGYSVYQVHMSVDLHQHLALARRLERALAEDQLQVYFQPQVDLRTGALTGAEALLRWYDPQWGWISPDRFISVAEERRMIGAVGDWVVQAVCRQLAAWRDAATLLPGPVFLNVAAQQLEDTGLPDRIHETVAAAGLSPGTIGLELTETGIMRDPEQAETMTRQLKQAGFQLSIDDFGTGYSSLAYLKRFPADTLKIDRSFVRDMLVDDNDYAIVTTIIAMARALGLRTLAEGVEQAGQAEKLLALGCDEAQGYYFGRPQPANVFHHRWLCDTPRRSAERT